MAAYEDESVRPGQRRLFPPFPSPLPPAGRTPKGRTKIKQHAAATGHRTGARCLPGYTFFFFLFLLPFFLIRPVKAEDGRRRDRRDEGEGRGRPILPRRDFPSFSFLLSATREPEGSKREGLGGGA